MARAPLGRQQLLNAAREELVGRNGVIELAALTQRAGLSTGALYHHFGSKSGLVVAVYNSFYEGLREAIADANVASGPTWADRERARTALFVRYHFDDPLAPVLLGRAAPDAEWAELEAVHLDHLSRDAATNIRNGQADGDLPRSIDPDSAGAFVIGGLRHAIAQQLRAKPRPTSDEATERLWHLIAAALDLA